MNDKRIPMKEKTTLNIPPLPVNKPSIYDFLNEIETCPEYKTTPRPAVYDDTRTANADTNGMMLKKEMARNKESNDIALKEKLILMSMEIKEKTDTIEELKNLRTKDNEKLRRREEELAQQHQEASERLRKTFESNKLKQLEFAQQIIRDKAELARQCEELLTELARSKNEIAKCAEESTKKLKESKEKWASQEKVKRDQWMKAKTDEIKKATVKGLEPEIQKLIAKFKLDLQHQEETSEAEKRDIRGKIEKEYFDKIEELKKTYDKQLDDIREEERKKAICQVEVLNKDIESQLMIQRQRMLEENERSTKSLKEEISTLKNKYEMEMNQMKENQELRMIEYKKSIENEKKHLIENQQKDEAIYKENMERRMQEYEIEIKEKYERKFENSKKEYEIETKKKRNEEIDKIIEKLHLENYEKQKIQKKQTEEHYQIERQEHEKRIKEERSIQEAWKNKYDDLANDYQRLLSEREDQNNIIKNLDEKMQHEELQMGDLTEELRQCKKKLSETKSSLQMEANRKMEELEQKLMDFRNSMTRLSNENEAIKVESARIQETMTLKHEKELDDLHERVRSAINKKDDIIKQLSEDMYLLQIRLGQTETLLEHQKKQRITD